MIGSIQKRVEELKQEPEWKEKWTKRLEEYKKKRLAMQQSVQQDDDMKVNVDRGDIGSYMSGGNMFGGGSVASDKTKESIDEIRQKMQSQKGGKGDWENRTNVDSNAVALEERLAKHIADELLRSNMALRNVHSNQSIRKIMERELKKQLEDTVAGQE